MPRVTEGEICSLPSPRNRLGPVGNLPRHSRCQGLPDFAPGVWCQYAHSQGTGWPALLVVGYHSQP